MIKSVSLSREIQVSACNKVGILAVVSKLLADKGINIQAITGHVVCDEAKIMFITEDVSRTTEALGKAGLGQIRENQVIVVELENRPGALKTITSLLAENKIDIREIYGTASAEGCTAQVVLSTSDNDKAMVALKK